jgi:ABC-type transporter Mla MlaB component
MRAGIVQRVDGCGMVYLVDAIDEDQVHGSI